MNKLYLMLFLSILFLGTFLRFYKINEIPPGVNRDEASIGYTAYSLLKTGADEYGKRFPISFQSFGDWKLPLYMYLTVLSVKLFDVSEFAVRIPSVLAGIATIGVAYFLIQELFGNKKLSLLAMFLIAVSPWSIHLSRVESESNTAVFLTTLGILLLLKGIRGKNLFIIPAYILLALTYFTYAGNYVFTTLLFLGTHFIFKEELIKIKYTLVGVLLFLLLSFGMIFAVQSANTTKLSGISIFGDPSIVHAKIEIPRNEHSNPASISARILHNRILFAVERFAQNYLNAFSPDFLFIKGGENHAHNINNFGNMYIVEAPFLFLGILYLLINKKGKGKKLVLWWFLISPIAASITKDAPHTNRMFAIFPILPLVTALGMYYFLSLFKNDLHQKIIPIGIACIFILNMSIYIDRYFVHFPRNEGQSWGIGYNMLSSFMTQKEFSSREIIMSKPEYSPYIFLLFYQKYDPKKYQTSVVRYPPTEDQFVHVKQFDRYIFRKIDWEKDTKISNRLLIDDPKKIPDFIKNKYPTFQIALPDGNPMFTVVNIQ